MKQTIPRAEEIGNDAEQALKEADPFYSPENIAELERRIAGVKNGTSKLEEHELIEVDDE